MASRPSSSLVVLSLLPPYGADVVPWPSRFAHWSQARSQLTLCSRWLSIGPGPPIRRSIRALDSFPSGHVLQAVVIFGLVPFLLWALTERRSFLRFGFAVFVVVVVSVAVRRVRLGAHWPSDVIVSFFIGASLLIGAEQLLTSTWATDRCASLGYHPPDQPRRPG